MQETGCVLGSDGYFLSRFRKLNPSEEAGHVPKHEDKRFQHASFGLRTNTNLSRGPESWEAKTHQNPEIQTP